MSAGERAWAGVTVKMLSIFGLSTVHSKPGVKWPLFHIPPFSQVSKNLEDKNTAQNLRTQHLLALISLSVGVGGRGPERWHAGTAWADLDPSASPMHLPPPHVPSSA